MAYLEFNKAKLVNLEYSLDREMLATTRTGGYTSSTIVCCNTRKYHGLLVVPIEQFDSENYVLLSSLDETIVQHGQSFNLGIHRFPGVYEPRGHKYIVDFAYEPVASITYQVGGVVLRKEILLIHNEDGILLRYTLLDAHSPTTLRLKPFLAYRNIHALSKANMEADTRYQLIPNGIKSKLYRDFPSLHMQFNKANDFVACPDWYYNVEYREEQRRGYEYCEDLFTPGYFELPVKKGDSIIFSASVVEQKPPQLKRKFEQQLAARPSRDSYENCLKVSAAQFIVQRNGGVDVVAGYPWFGRWGRDTFISLPGLTLAANYHPQACKDVLDTLSNELSGGLFPNIGTGRLAAYNSVDAPLWYFWAIQQYAAETHLHAEVWNDYGEKMKSILQAYRSGQLTSIRMHDNGLIWAEEPGKALTWMDAIVHGVPVTPRSGYQVEINALWYNAICYTLELARQQKGEEAFIAAWEHLPALIEKNYLPTFWSAVRRHLADYVGEEGQNIFTRPNQVFACSLPYSPITDETKRDVLRAIENELLTPKGLRTLAPKNPLYKSRYEGAQPARDNAYHQGTVWPWLLGAYIEANFRLYGKPFLPTAKELVAGFEEDMTLYGLCSIAEIYDGDPPHTPNGCISQAWSVAEILRSMKLIEKYETL
ncbi:MAG: amylo-alpha-1,6-glucosidase [Prevotellaceae bacterium]|jgi:predicted glycogen debranching enzyme|nr:amylo-alpha-1,6-glucosidase [Prevotellaceae bacterium]